MGQRALARHRFDAAHAGRDAGFGDNLEQADIAGALDMRAAAQLGGEVAHTDDTHLVAVLLTEQRHGAALDSIVIRHDARRDVDILLDFPIDQLLDARNLLGAHRLRMGKIETRAIGVHQRALLLHVFPQNLAQRCMHEMGGRMIPGRALAQTWR